MLNSAPTKANDACSMACAVASLTTVLAIRLFGFLLGDLLVVLLHGNDNGGNDADGREATRHDPVTGHMPKRCTSMTVYRGEREPQREPQGDDEGYRRRGPRHILEQKVAGA
jgi:hypothetical protein